MATATSCYMRRSLLSVLSLHMEYCCILHHICTLDYAQLGGGNWYSGDSSFAPYGGILTMEVEIVHIVYQRLQESRHQRLVYRIPNCEQQHVLLLESIELGRVYIHEL